MDTSTRSTVDYKFGSPLGNACPRQGEQNFVFMTSQEQSGWLRPCRWISVAVLNNPNSSLWNLSSVIESYETMEQLQLIQLILHHFALTST